MTVEEFKEILKETIKINDQISSELDKDISDKFGVKRFFLQILQRISLNYICIINVLNHYQTNTEFKVPIFILFRSLISDFLLTASLAEYIEVDNDTLEIEEDKFKSKYKEITSRNYWSKFKNETKWAKINSKDQDEILESEKTA